MKRNRFISEDAGTEEATRNVVKASAANQRAAFKDEASLSPRYPTSETGPLYRSEDTTQFGYSHVVVMDTNAEQFGDRVSCLHFFPVQINISGLFSNAVSSSDCVQPDEKITRKQLIRDSKEGSGPNPQNERRP